MYLVEVCLYNTPWKINMGPTNHQFGKENDLNQTSIIMVHVNLPGCKGHEFFWKFIYNSSYSMELEPTNISHLPTDSQISQGFSHGEFPEGRFLFHIPCKVDRYQLWVGLYLHL